MIETNDIVNVYFSRAEALFNCRVTYRPCAEGDSWELEDKHGIDHRVGMFERMDFVGRAEEAAVGAASSMLDPERPLDNPALNPGAAAQRLVGADEKAYQPKPPVLPPDKIEEWLIKVMAENGQRTFATFAQTINAIIDVLDDRRPK
jgi:hypothetical protein